MGARRHHSGQTYDTPRGLRGDVGAMFCGEPCRWGRGWCPGYHWRLIGMVFCGCFFVFWWPVVLVVILLLFLWLQILCVSCVLS